MTNKRIILIAWLLLVITLPVTAQQRVIKGRVVGVSDGDTLTLLDGNNKQHKVRLEGIDAPESAQAFGTQAKKSLSDLVFGRTVTVTSSKRETATAGRWGR